MNCGSVSASSPMVRSRRLNDLPQHLAVNDDAGGRGASNGSLHATAESAACAESVLNGDPAGVTPPTRRRRYKRLELIRDVRDDVLELRHLVVERGFEHG